MGELQGLPVAVGEATALQLLPVPGVRLGVARAGIRRGDGADLMLLDICAGASVAAVFTRNAFCAAPVLVSRRHLAVAAPRLLLVNAGNANAGTGEPGVSDALYCCRRAAELAGLSPEQVLPFSTGVIGEPLPVSSIVAALPAAAADLSAAAWDSAARSIMTTDTRPKGASRRLTLGAGEVTITGIAKGAGMIRPDMATMLSFVATDARVEAGALQALLARAVDRSFNRITIDGDTSTNDAVVLVASGASGVVITEDSAEWPAFAAAIASLFVELAQAVVSDGEGATRFVSVDVVGGESPEACLAVAYAVAQSPLVKTAIYAGDANWGRILAAVGRAGLDDLDVSAVRILVNDVLIAERGARAASYCEADGSAAMASEAIEIRIELSRGEHSETVWTTDLSHEYIRINAEYRS